MLFADMVDPHLLEGIVTIAEICGAFVAVIGGTVAAGKYLNGKTFEGFLKSYPEELEENPLGTYRRAKGFDGDPALPKKYYPQAEAAISDIEQRLYALMPNYTDSFESFQKFLHSM
jgi:hypothetical protein